MRGAVWTAALGVALAFAAAQPVAAQHWPAYGDYGYGTGFDYPRNVYSYPRLLQAQNPVLPQDNITLYGGYMPNAYYSGAAYPPERGALFESGQAYCQTAGSFLYCADIQSGTASLLAAGREPDDRRLLAEIPLRVRSASIYSGVLATRTVGSTTTLTGTLRSEDGEEVTVDCSGPQRGNRANLACR